VNDVLNLTSQHKNNRKSHIESLKNVLNLVHETISKNSTLQDLDVIEENIANLNQRHDDLSQ